MSIVFALQHSQGIKIDNNIDCILIPQESHLTSLTLTGFLTQEIEINFIKQIKVIHTNKLLIKTSHGIPSRCNIKGSVH